jgi:proteic killer suppression protein
MDDLCNSTEPIIKPALPTFILEISFQSEELLNLCIDESIADERLGTAVAESLRNRLSDIRAADSIHELLAGRPQAVRFGDQDGYRLEIEAGTWLIVVPNHIKPRADVDGRPDWGSVRRVCVVAVGDLECRT